MKDTIMFVFLWMLAGLNVYAIDSHSEADFQIVAYADNPTIKTKGYKGKNQLFYFSNGESMAPDYYWTSDRGEKVSYFRWISRVAVNGPNNQIAFLAAHQKLNGQAPSIFLRQSDGSLKMLFRFQADARTKQTPFHDALSKHARHIVTIAERPSQKLMDALFHPFASMFWGPEHKNLVLAGKSNIFLIDPENGSVKIKNAKPLRAMHFFPQHAEKLLHLVPPENGDGTPFLFHPKKGVHRFSANASFEKLFLLSKYPPLKDPFGEMVTPQKPKTKHGLQVFGSGSHFYHQGMILDKTGKPMLAMHEAYSHFDIAKQAPLLVTASSNVKTIKVISLPDQQVKATAKFKGEQPIVEISPSGRLILLKTKKFQKRQKPHFDMALYELDGDQLTLIHNQEDVQDAFLGSDRLWFRESGDTQLQTINSKGEVVQTSLNFPETSRWVFVQNQAVLYTNIPFQGSTSPNHDLHRSQFQQSHQDVVNKHRN